jgi:hypothetical protein
MSVPFMGKARLIINSNGGRDMFRRNKVPGWLGVMVVAGVFLMGTACSIPPDLALLVDFVNEDDILMLNFFLEEPDPGPGTEVTLAGPGGGTCTWSIPWPPLGQMPIVTYDYQDYVNNSGLIVNGARSGEMSLDSMWVINGTHEISGSRAGWIDYSFPFDIMGQPRLEDRVWFVCDYSPESNCNNALGDTTGLTAYYPRDVRQPWRIDLP